MSISRTFLYTGSGPDATLTSCFKRIVTVGKSVKADKELKQEIKGFINEHMDSIYV